MITLNSWRKIDFSLCPKNLKDLLLKESIAESYRKFAIIV